MGNKVTKEHIAQMLANAKVEDLKIGEKTTLVHVTLESGFTITESSSCVDPDNYDHELGKSIAMKRVEDKLWMLEGYVLSNKKVAF
jgi:hypothetical protein